MHTLPTDEQEEPDYCRKVVMTLEELVHFDF